MRQLYLSTVRNVMVFMTQSADHVTGLTGATLTITASKDGAAFASISPTVTERGDGWYSVALTASHTDTLGDFVLHVTATSADPTDLVSQVVPELLTVGGIQSGLATSASVAAIPINPLLDNDARLNALDATISSRLATAGYTAPDNTGIAAIQAKTDAITVSGGLVDVDVKKMNGATVNGTGIASDLWRGA